jgi:hypothetical protein
MKTTEETVIALIMPKRFAFFFIFKLRHAMVTIYEDEDEESEAYLHHIFLTLTTLKAH